MNVNKIAFLYNHCCSWQEAYQKTQKGYNVQLGVYGIAFVVTIVIVSILAVTVALVRLLHFFQFPF
jgi:hypothetical protein